MNIGIDTQIANLVVDELKRNKFKVTRANSKEPDIEWVTRAINAGALFIISPDKDIPRILNKLNCPAIWIDLPDKTSGLEQFQYIDNRIKSILKLFQGIK